MIPTVEEICAELKKIENIDIYLSQCNELEVIMDNVLLFKVTPSNPTDAFLNFYIEKCSI